MSELLKGRALKWFIANIKQWRIWAEFIESFHTYFLPRDFFTRLADQVRQRKQGFSESFKDYMIDMQTMVRPLNYSTKETLRVIKENCTPSLRIFLRAYKVSDLDMLMILADEYEELEKERELFAQEDKFSKTNSASPTQVTCRRCEETDNQDTRGNDQWYPPHQARRRQATDAPRGAQWTPPPQQQRQPNNTLWRPPSNTQRPQDATHITDPQEICRKCGGKPAAVILLDLWQGGCQERRLLPTIGKWPPISAAESRAVIA